MKKVALCIENYIIDYSPSILNLIDYFSEFLSVHLYLRKVYFVKSNILEKQNVTVFRIKNKITLSFLIKHVIYLLKELVKTVMPHKESMLFKRTGGISLEKIRKKISESDYAQIICVDPGGFLLCKELFPACCPFYYSLELFLKDDYLWNYYPSSLVRRIHQMMDLERSKISDIAALIIQSEEKADLFKNDYKITAELPTYILPVTYRGKAVNEKSTFLRDTYGIEENKLIALHLGGMNDWFSSIEIARIFCRIPQWVLFFQGYHNKKYLKRFKKEMKKLKAKNIMVSETFYDQLDSLDRIMMSADLGIAWYNDISKNFTTAGKSSGKISAYLRFGLPVIAKKYPSTQEVIEDSGCGRCVDHFEEIIRAVKEIEQNFKTYSENARKEYEKNYWFENYRKTLTAFILGEP